MNGLGVSANSQMEEESVGPQGPQPPKQSDQDQGQDQDQEAEELDEHGKEGRQQVIENLRAYTPVTIQTQ